MKKDVIWVNGVFDVLHIGHLKLLKHASKLGLVVVGIDSDDRVRSMKGEGRPINSQKQRKIRLLSLSYVHSVLIFDSDQELLQHMINTKASTIVIGDDHKENIVGESLFKNIILYKRVKNFSSTKIINEDISNRR